MHWAEYVYNEQNRHLPHGTVSRGPLMAMTHRPSLGRKLSSPFTPPPPLPSALLVLLFFHTCFVALCGFSISMTTLHWLRSGKTKFFPKGQIIIVVGSAGPAASVVIGEA